MITGSENESKTSLLHLGSDNRVSSTEVEGKILEKVWSRANTVQTQEWPGRSIFIVTQKGNGGKMEEGWM